MPLLSPPGYTPTATCSTTPPQNGLGSGGDAQDFGKVVVFMYKSTKHLLPRPSSYDEAVALVQDFIQPFDQLRLQARFMVRLPYFSKNEDMEITAPVWAHVSKKIGLFKVLLTDKPQKLSLSPEPALLAQATGRPSSIFSLPPSIRAPTPITVKVTNLQGSLLCVLSVSRREDTTSIQRMIEEKALIPTSQQTILHGERTLVRQMERYELFPLVDGFSPPDFRDGDILRLCRKLELCKKCRCGPGSKAEVEEEREIENIRLEFRRQESLRLQQGTEARAIEAAKIQRAEALAELKQRRPRRASSARLVDI